MRNSVPCVSLLNIHIGYIFDAFGVVCSRAAQSLNICEAVRYQEMGDTVLVKGGRVSVL